MARITLQIKNVASLVLATTASVSWGLAARRFFDTPQKNWALSSACGALSLGLQLALIFVESKEEEELSLIRLQRIAALKQLVDETETLSQRIQTEMSSGKPGSVEKWIAIKRDRYGK